VRCERGEDARRACDGPNRPTAKPNTEPEHAETPEAVAL
jgi:hypothetical protein